MMLTFCADARASGRSHRLPLGGWIEKSARILGMATELAFGEEP